MPLAIDQLTQTTLSSSGLGSSKPHCMKINNITRNERTSGP